MRQDARVILRCLIAIGLVFSVTSAFAGELEKAKAEFAKHDRELNKVYQELRRELPAELFKVLRQEQRDWIEYRDYIADWQAFGKDLETSTDRWSMRAELTRAQVGWLKMWRLRDQRKGWAGKYNDGHGGILYIIKKGEVHHFGISVVRGPTFHLGDISGVLKIEGEKASFETRAEPDAKLTTLTFSPVQDGSGRIQVEGKNTHWYHGARAYFDGQYIWAGELTLQDRKEMELWDELR